MLDGKEIPILRPALTLLISLNTLRSFVLKESLLLVGRSQCNLTETMQLEQTNLGVLSMKEKNPATELGWLLRPRGRGGAS